MFKDHFDVFLADTPESRKINYEIRYQVYCEEMGFENKDDFPDQREFDEDDDRSVHFIVRNKMTDQWVGAVRLIHTKNDSVLPIEKNADLNEKASDNDQLGAVEMSRLCIIKDVRRREKDIDPPHGIIREDILEKTADTTVTRVPVLSRNRLNRMIIWALFHATAEYCTLYKKQYCYFMTTAVMAKVLLIGGLGLIKVGGAVKHKGERFPFKVDAIAAYHSDIWKGGFNDFQLYSSLDKVDFPQAA